MLETFKPIEIHDGYFDNKYSKENRTSYILKYFFSNIYPKRASYSSKMNSEISSLVRSYNSSFSKETKMNYNFAKIISILKKYDDYIYEPVFDEILRLDKTPLILEFIAAKVDKYNIDENNVMYKLFKTLQDSLILQYRY